MYLISPIGLLVVAMLQQRFMFAIGGVNASMTAFRFHTIGQGIGFVQVVFGYAKLKTIWPSWTQEVQNNLRWLKLDIDFLRINCADGEDNPKSKVLYKIAMVALYFPVSAFAHIAWAKIRGVPPAWPRYHASMGMFMGTVYVTLVIQMLEPLHCLTNPNGKATLKAYPSVLCQGSEIDADDDAHANGIDVHGSVCAVSVRLPHPVSVGG
jgi:hypothetical protein